MSWVNNPPSAFDIVAGYFPENNPREGGPEHRPLLVLRVLQNKETGDFACKVAYGTKNIQLLRRGEEDLIISNLSTMNRLGLKYPTRFVLSPASNLLILPWKPPHFEPWTGYATPTISTLDHEMAKEVVWRLAGR